MIDCSCPQARRIAFHKQQMQPIWDDPEYQRIAESVYKGEVCAFCGRPAELAHHDEDWMYATKEAYYDPNNMTPACGKCHFHYRRGLVICPTCLSNGTYHYMVRGSEECSRHRVGRHVRQQRGKYRKVVVRGEWKKILR